MSYMIVNWVLEQFYRQNILREMSPWALGNCVFSQFSEIS